MALRTSAPPARFELNFLTLRSVTAPEDTAAGRKRYCGVAKANELLKLPTDENVRDYLGKDDEGRRRKATLVNLAIRETVESNRDQFQLLNSGLVVVARRSDVDDNKKVLKLSSASIINGAQTQGVIADYFAAHADDDEFPSINFEVVVTDDEDLIAEISIARNFQNRVADLSIYGRKKLFDELEEALQKHDKTITLRRAETDFSETFLDTEKLIQVLTVLTPTEVRLPSAEARKLKTAETIYRVYAYRHRSRCLKDFATVMDDSESWPEAHELFLQLAWDAWQLYEQLRGEQTFSALHKGQGDTLSGKKIVASDGVPDGIVFPMLSALSRFVRRSRSGWRLDIPKSFPWKALFNQAIAQFKTTAAHNPQSMGKNADCYVALHGAIDMYFAVTGNSGS
jgi:AIPR protein